MLSRFDNVPIRERVIVALDCPGDEAFALADQLQGKAYWLKVGMTLYYSMGPSIVKRLKEKGYNVFLDLKLHDIPFQVEGAAASAISSGADMITMHCLGGVEMMKAAQRGVENACSVVRREPAVTLGITVLTSMDDEALRGVGIPQNAKDQVLLLARSAQKSGISGVVASPNEAAMLRDLLGPDAYIVTPGVRPEGSEIADHSRVATPKQAFASGASHIVIGRPITRAALPVVAFEEILSQI